MLTKLLAPLLPLLVKAVFEYLEAHPKTAAKLLEPITSKMPDLSKLDEQILGLFPDLSKLPAQVAAEVARIPAQVIDGIRDLLPQIKIPGLPNIFKL